MHSGPVNVKLQVSLSLDIFAAVFSKTDHEVLHREVLASAAAALHQIGIVALLFLDQRLLELEFSFHSEYILI